MKNGDVKWVTDESWPKSRTLRSFQQDLANLLAEEDETGRTWVSGRDHHSIARQPEPLNHKIINDLRPSTGYRFRVTVVNNNERGNYSDLRDGRITKKAEIQSFCFR